MVYSFKDTCRELGIGRTKLNQLCAERMIEFTQERPGCKRTFTSAQIQKYLDDNKRRARRL